MVNFEDENGNDTAGAMSEACRNLANFKWIEDEVDFYFSQCEARMAAAGVKKQFTKFQVMATILPQKVIMATKHILKKKETEFENNKAYKTLKDEIIRIFGPRAEGNVEKALKRTLTDTPSQLARDLVNDICTTNLVDCACCPPVVLALWKKHLPGPVRAAIANLVFDADNFNNVVELADDVYDTLRPSGVAIAAATFQPVTLQSATMQPATAINSLNETQPGIPYAIQAPNQAYPAPTMFVQPGMAAPQIAAINRGGRGGRGSGRGGGRGNRGNRGNRGGGNNSNNQNGGNRRGPRHPDQPPPESCSMHWKHGKSSYFCTDPHNCPWVNKTAPRSQSQ